MKKTVKVTLVLLCIAFIGVIGFKIWSAKLVKEARELVDVSLDMSNVEDGIYEGYSELGPVIVDVKVTVECSKIMDIEIVEHQNGFGQLLQ